MVSQTSLVTGSGSGTVTPGGTLLGWQLTTSNIGLVGAGVDRASLAVYSGPSQLARGTTITDRKITVPIDMYAGDCTLRRCWIAPTSLGNPNGAFVSTVRFVGADNAQSPVGNNLVEDCEIDGDAFALNINIASACAFVGCATVSRCYMHGMGSGIAVLVTGATLSARLENNYVRGLRGFGDPGTTGSHNEATTVRDFPNATGRTLKWVGNRFDCSTSGNDSGGVFIQPLWGPIANVTIDDNYLEGGGYNLYTEDHSGNSYSNVVVRNNRFRPTGFGAAAVAGGPGFTTWTNNYIYNASDPDGKGAVVPNP